MSNAKILVRQKQIRDTSEAISAVHRDLNSAVAAALNAPGVAATMREIKAVMAETARLQRDTNKRIKAIKAKHKVKAEPVWRKTPPDADGMWLLRCMEHPTPGLVRVFTHDGNVMAECDIGTVGLMDLHNGLTEVRWARASTAEPSSAQQAHKQGLPKRSKREPTLEPTKK